MRPYRAQSPWKSHRHVDKLACRHMPHTVNRCDMCALQMRKWRAWSPPRGEWSAEILM
jgi:hypothetical protein